MCPETYQVWLLTAGVVHFCPTRLCCSAWLGENLSCCPSPPRTQELPPARPLRSYKPSCPSSTGGKGFAASVRARRGGEVSSSQPFFGLLFSLWGTEKTRVFPTLGEHSFGATRPSSSPKNKPPCPSPLPPTHTLSVSCPHSQLGSRISGQRGRPENSRKHQKQLRGLVFLYPRTSVWAWGVYTCSALS